MTNEQGTWVLDCDGVIWRGDQPISGAAEAVKSLRDSGRRVVFLTNNSYPQRSGHLDKLAAMGMASHDEDLMSSPAAVARLLDPGSRVLLLGGPGITEALEARGVMSYEPGEEPGGIKTDAVVVGMDIKFDFARLAAATTALRGGARLLATNDDATFPAAEGLWPGAGSILAAVATAGGVEPEIAGKPYPSMVCLVRDSIHNAEILVGDRPSTDGLMARAMGIKFGLVLTGVTPADHGAIDPRPDVEAADLASLVDEVLSAN